MKGSTSPETPRDGAPEARAHDEVGHPVRLVGRIAREHLIAAVAGEHHLDRVLGQIGHHELGQRRHVGGRIVEVPDQRGQEALDVSRRAAHLAVARAEMRAHLPRPVLLAEARLVEAHVERVEGAPERLRHEGHDGARVEAAREKGADRGLRDALAPHRGGQRRLDAANRFPLVARGGGEIRIPVEPARALTVLPGQ